MMADEKLKNADRKNADCKNADCKKAGHVSVGHLTDENKKVSEDGKIVCGEKKYRIAVIPGSFDPVTLGHIDIIRRAAEIFDEVRAVIFINSDKKYKFTAEQRLELLSASCKAEFGDDGKVIAELSEGLLADYVVNLSDENSVAGKSDVGRLSESDAGRLSESDADKRCETKLSCGVRKCAVIVKGIRNSSDFDYEFWLASINRSVLPIGAETFFIPACPELSYINSTVVREMLRYDKSVRHYIPSAAADLIEKWQINKK